MKNTKKQQELRATILDKIYTKGPISRIDISKETGITPATVTEITGILLHHKMIHEHDFEETDAIKSGRKKVFLDISRNVSFEIGVELSEKYVSFCLADNTGHVLDQKIIQFSNPLATESLTEEQLINELQSFIESHSEYKITAVGIALPGHFDAHHQTIISNHPFWKEFNLAEIAEKISLPIYFENNVECMTIAQRLFGHQQSDDNFIFLHVARGMFCSYMYEGQIYGRSNFLVGEIGFTIVHPDRESGNDVTPGNLQSYASEAAIIKKAKMLFDHSPNTYMRELAKKRDDIQIQTVLQAYRLGDQGVIKILEDAIKYLANTLQNLSLLIDSKVMYLHGELFNERSLFQTLTDRINANAQNWFSREQQPLILLPYKQIDGARAACGLVIDQTLLGAAR